MAVIKVKNNNLKLKSNRENALHLRVLKSSKIYQRGFTLIEYLVAITILAALLGGILIAFNPFTQVERGRDTQRRQDLQQIKNALEAYYQDNSCYPEEIPFGEEWGVGGDTYMVEVPQDSTCGQPGGECYYYITESEGECPQWNVIFARLSEVPAQDSTICPLSSISDTCVPEDYNDRWACVMSGAVDCNLIALRGFSYDDGSEEEIPVPTGPFVVPTLAPGGVVYSLGGGANFNPYLKTMTIAPVWPQPDTAQNFLLNAEDSTSDITNVRLHLYSDSGNQVLTLNFVGGTLRNGYWSGTISADTYNNVYTMAIVAQNANGARRCTVLTPGGYVAGPDTICSNINN